MNGNTVGAAERPAWRIDGFVGLGVLVLVIAVAGYLGYRGVMTENVYLIVLAAVLAILALLPARVVILNPNEAGVITFFGTYVGSIKHAGFHVYMPFGSLERVTLRLINFEVGPMKVNDAGGNPILIGAIVVIRVEDTFKARFNVEDWTSFAETQAETAVRTLAATYPYDSGDGDDPSLLRHHDQVRHALIEDMKRRLEPAGLEVDDARLSHLAYAPEIAAAMLRRQQAKATVQARRQIAEGAAAIVEGTLAQLRAGGSVTLDDRDLSRVAANLMVILTSEQAVTPVIDVSE